MRNRRFAETFFRQSAKFLVKYRNAAFMVMIVSIVAGLFFADRIKIDNSLELWFLEDDPTLIAYREFKAIYGNDEIILALIAGEASGGTAEELQNHPRNPGRLTEPNPETIFSKRILNGIYKASKELERDKANFKRVLSIGLAPYIGLKDQDLLVEDLMTGTLVDDADAERIKRRFLDDPFKRKILADLDRKYAVMLIEPVASPEMDEKRPIIIRAVKECLKGLDYRLAGMGVMYEELNTLSIRDGLTFSIISYIVIALLIFIFYRSKIMFSMAVATMIFNGLAFVAVYGVFRQNFNMVTIVLPTLMMVLSISDVAYVYNNYCVNIGRMIENKEEGLSHVFNQVLSPCLFTSLTNTFGFLAITASPMAVLRAFGIFAAFASSAEYIISMIVSAFILGFYKPTPDMRISRRPFASLVSQWMIRMPHYYKEILIITAVLSAIALYGISILTVDTYSMGFLDPSNHVRIDSDHVEKAYGNYLPLEIRLLTGKQDGIKHPQFLSLLDKAHLQLEKLPSVEKAASIIDVLKKLNQVMSNPDTKSADDGIGSSSDNLRYYTVPDTFEKVSQLLMLYESDPKNDLIHMTNVPSYSEARLTVRVPMVSAAKLHEIEIMVEKTLQEIFKDYGVKLRFGGYVPLYSRIINYITKSQLQSFALAFIFVFGAVAILFKRLDAIILMILPNLFPVVMTLGVMGFCGVRLDIATVTIAAIAMGIVVDDTIHELFLFFESSDNSSDPVGSIIKSLDEAGSAVVCTSLIYSAGFLVLIFASIKSVMYFGALISLTIFLALICEVTVLPAQICLCKGLLSRKVGTEKNNEERKS